MDIPALSFIKLRDKTNAERLFKPVMPSKPRNKPITLPDISGIVEDSSALMKSYKFEDPKPAQIIIPQRKIDKLMRKYRIDKEVQIEDEEREMSKAFETSRNKDFWNNKITITTEEGFFEQPQDSIRALKHNSKLVSTISTLRNRLEQTKYKEKQSDWEKTKEIQMRMPEVQVTTLASKDNRLMQATQISTTKVSKGKASRRRLVSDTAMFKVSNTPLSVVRPVARAYSSLNIVNKALILVYGIGSQIMNEIWEGHLIEVYGEITIEWAKIKVRTFNVSPMYGHTSVNYAKSLIIFGGCDETGTTDKLYQFDVKNRSVMYKKVSKMENNKRKYHIAVVVGIDMLVHGGRSPTGKIIGSTYFLDLVMYKWHRIYFPGPELRLSDHCACVVNSVRKEPKDLNLFNLSTFFSSSANYRKRTATDGIYIYGGIDEHEEISDTLYKITIGEYPLDWNPVETKGNNPPPLKGAKLDYNEPLVALVLTGGLTLNEEERLDTIYLLYLDTATWMSVGLAGTQPRPSSGLNTIQLNNNLLVFGGMSHSCFAGNNVYSVDLSYPLIRTF